MAALSWIVIAALIFVSARRCVLLIGAVRRPPGATARGPLPSVLVVVSARNEEQRVEPLLRALEGLQYSDDHLFFVLVNDGSGDRTPELFERWCAGRPRSVAVSLSKNVGKASALNAARQVAPTTELVAIYDADQRPHPDSLALLAAAFLDSRVGAVSGYRLPSNADCGVVSRYAALETWVHQLIVQRGKDRLRLNPPTMGGNCVYRVRALNEVGGFPSRTFSEDVEVSLALVAHGWRTLFVEDAIAENEISDTLATYVSQRTRWTFGMYHATRQARSIESVMVSSGYADRLAFAAGCLLAFTGHISPAWPALYLVAPALEALTALAMAGRLQRAALYLISAVPMFLVDIGLTVCATAFALIGRRPQWE